MKAKFLALAALVLGLASCQTEPEGFDVVVGGEQEVTINVTLPDATRTTNAASNIGGLSFFDDANYDIRYILEIYQNGTRIKERDVILSDNGSVAFPVRLVPGRDYTFVVWADFVTNGSKEDLHYNTDTERKGLTNITLKGDWTAMDETRDAYSGVQIVTGYNGANGIDMELHRPFAKVRVVTTDIAALTAINNLPTAVEIEYTNNVCTTFNALSGAATGEYKYVTSYTLKDVQQYTDVTGSQTLYAGYVFANEQASVANFSMSVTLADGETVDNNFNTSIPVQRNMVTTITGDLLTDANNINVEIKPGFDGSFDEEYTPVRVSTAQELQNAISEAVNGEETIIVLGGDIDLSDLLTRAADPTLTVAAGKVIFIDLNGKTLTSTSVATGANYNMFDVRGTLTIKNGTITTKHEGTNMEWNNSTNVFNITAGGVLNLDGVTAKNLGGSDMAFVAHLNNWGEVTLNVNNSTLESTYIAVRVFNSGNDKNNVTIENSTLKGKYCFWVHNYTLADFGNNQDKVDAHKALLNFDIYNTTDQDSNNNVFEFTNTYGAPVLYGFTDAVYFNEYGDEYVANGVGMADGNYVVYNAEGMLWVVEQVNNETIVLGADIDLGGQGIAVAAGKTLTLDLNGKTLSATETATGSFGLITNKGNLTVKNGTMTLEAVNNRAWNAYSSVISNNPGGNLVVENATIEHLGGTDMAYGIDNLTNGRGTSAVATINEGAVVKSVYRAVRQFLNGTEATNSLTVNAGAVIEGTNKSIWMQDPSANANTGTLVVNEGATLKGDVYLYVTAGSTEWPVSVSIADSTLSEQSQVLYGNVPSGYGVILEDGIWKVVKNGVNNYVLVSNAEELIALSDIKPGAKVFVLADIDLTGKTFNGLTAFHSENKNTFDGQGHTISNWTYVGGAADMGFIRQWVGEVRNFRLENCHLKTAGRSAIVAAKIYGNISYVDVANCSIDDSYWACGAIAGLYNAGDITNCTVTNTTDKSNGGTGGIVGDINEEGGLRAVRNCSVTNSTINNTGIYGEVYSGGGIVGMFNASGTYEITDCTVSNNTLAGGHIYEICPEDENLTIE